MRHTIQAKAPATDATPVKRPRGRPRKEPVLFDPKLNGAQRSAKLKASVFPALSAGEIAALKEAPGLDELLDEEASGKDQKVKISAPRFRTAIIAIRGISPYVQNAFSQKSRDIMESKQREGQQAQGKRVRTPKDFEANYQNAMHIAKEGWVGIPASAFRNAMIDACRLCGVKMTHAKLSIFVEEDGYDRNEEQPLVRIEGEPRIHKMSVRNESGVADIRWRPCWDKGKWSAMVRVTWDLDQYSATDIANLMLRAGLQVGIGEGRPNSPNSNGLGWGRFEIAS